ncbi:MAG TPA: DUF1553 domain-containing protein, partial [Gemmataceae bacterium]
LIDSLLRRPEFADFWALKWSDLLRNEEKALDPKGVRVLHRWVRASFAAGKPLNEFARELIAGLGSTYANPPANFYRALRDPYSRSEAVAQVFLGVRLQCTRCHNHPFDRWKRQEYHEFAAFFGRIGYRVLENNRKDDLDKHEFDGEQVVYIDRAAGLKHPDTGERLQPRFLGAPTPGLGGRDGELQALADWVADPANPFFARAQVNRIWYHLTGRGLVEPNDDFRASNPPSNGPLLDHLTREFVASNFDVRHVIRLIMNSRTYQLSAVPNETNAEDEAHFSRAYVRPLQAEQLLDALAQVLGVPVEFQGYPVGTRAGEIAAPRFPSRRAPRGPGEKFLKAFGQPDRLLSCDCERSNDAGLVQAFQLLTGELLHDMLRRPDNRIGKSIADGLTDAEIVRRLYLAALCREPTPAEESGIRQFLERSPDRRAALEDVAWGVLNAKEFLLRR